MTKLFGSSTFEALCSAGLRLLLPVGCLCLLPAAPPAAARPLPASETAKERASEEKALTILNEMAQAYAALPGYEQRTEFSSALIPFVPAPTPFGMPLPPTEEPLDLDAPKDPPSAEGAEDGNRPRKKPRLEKTGRTLFLVYSPPNRLRLEMEEPGDSDTPGGVRKRLWVGDGKLFWSDEPSNRTYMKEASPKTLHEFPTLSSLNLTTLELLLLAGANPFAKLREETDSVRLLGSAWIRGVNTDIVDLKTHEYNADNEVRLYIGKTDRLLRRVVMDSTPIPAPLAVGKVGDPLDELVDKLDAPLPQNAPLGEQSGSFPPSPQFPSSLSAAGTLPMKTRLVYDNQISVREAFPERLFQYSPPEGYSLFLSKGAKLPDKPQKTKPPRVIRKKGKYFDLIIVRP